MDKLDRILRMVDEARKKDRAKPPKRISSKYVCYTTTRTKEESALRNAERINRNAPVITIKPKD